MRKRSFTLQPKSRNQNKGLAIDQTYQMEYHTPNGFKKKQQTIDIMYECIHIIHELEKKVHIQDSRSASSHDDEINK